MQSLKENWLLVPKMRRRIWWILMQAVTSLKICIFIGCFCRKYVMSEPKKVGELCLITLKNDAKFKEELTCALKNNIRSLVNFDPITEKFQNLHFNELFFTKVYNVWAKKVQKSYASRYWRLMQTLKKKWLVVS